jgi:NO-binding membrane sensor protein with MHYT domain
LVRPTLPYPISVGDTNIYRYLLIGSSISMGGIAIWGMHFLGNRAIILGNGDSALQVACSPAFMAVSFFLPIVVLLTAFITIGSNKKVSWLRVGLGGTLAGLSICGMHYLGQAGILNYSVEYMVANIVGSVLIAVVATITSLFVFFILRASWTASWWNRALAASLLAGAVSGMHWVAEVGTQYRLKQGDISTDGTLSRNSTVIVVIILVWRTSDPSMEVKLILEVCRYLSNSDYLLVACATKAGSVCRPSPAGYSCCSYL